MATTTLTKVQYHGRDVARQLDSTAFEIYLADSVVELSQIGIPTGADCYELVQRNMVCHYCALSLGIGTIVKNKVDGLEQDYAQPSNYGSALEATKYGKEAQRLIKQYLESASSSAQSTESIGITVLHFN